MNRFMAFVRKEFLHIFRDWRSMLVLLAYPVILVLLFGFAVTTEVKNVRVGILDMSEDGITRKIVDRIAANPYMTVVSQTKDIRTIYDNFDRGKTDVALVLGNNFANDLLHSGSASAQILVDGTEPNQAVIRQQYVSGILSAVARDEYGNHADTRPTINVVTRMLYNPQQKSEYNFVPGVIGMVLLIVCAMMSSMSIVREKETGTMEVLLASPLQPWCIVTAKLVPYFVISSFNLAAILLLSFYVLDVPMAGSPACFLGVTLVYILVALTFGLLVSTLVRTQLAAMLLSLLLVVPAVYLSGMAFPIESMPKVLQILSAIVPARWYVDAARKLMIQGTDAVNVAGDVIAMAIMECVLIVMSLKMFKVRI